VYVTALVPPPEEGVLLNGLSLYTAEERLRCTEGHPLGNEACRRPATAEARGLGCCESRGEWVRSVRRVHSWVTNPRSPAQVAHRDRQLRQPSSPRAATGADSRWAATFRTMVRASQARVSATPPAVGVMVTRS
jgi:hypothetical protein